MDSFIQRAMIVGATGAISQAIIHQLLQAQQTLQIIALSRNPLNLSHQKLIAIQCQLTDESAFAGCIQHLKARNLFAEPLDLIFVGAGFLHDQRYPEKNIQQLEQDFFMQNMLVNTWIPMHTAKHCIGLLNKRKKSVFATLAARVGSISDNHLGGWYSYRAAKAALVMFLKTLSIEQKRKNPEQIILGLHPGTVDTPLSAPFQKNIAKQKLFSQAYAAQRLLEVIELSTPTHSGQQIAWDGQKIDY